MGNKERIKQLEKFIEEEPNEPFNIYALALEHLSVDKQQSVKLFEELLAVHPEYISTYYHAAALNDSLGHPERAREIYEMGIAMAKKLNERHALKELQSAYLNFQFEND